MFHEIEHEDGVVEVVVDRPPVNALGIDDLHHLAEMVRELGRCPEVRVVLLRAEGAGFCGGGDVKEVQALGGFDGILGQARGAEAASLAILACEVPVVAAVHGYCVGVGAVLVACADVLVAAEGARLVLAEVDNGATSGAAQLANLLPERRLRRAMLTGESVSIEELERYGTVSVVPATELVVVARDVARAIARKPPAVVRRMKLSLEAGAPVERVRARYREELSYTYELNLLGEAGRARQETVDRLGARNATLPDG